MSQLLNAGWMDGNPTLGLFLGWREVHGGCMGRNSSSEIGVKWGSGSPLMSFAMGSMVFNFDQWGCKSNTYAMRPVSASIHLGHLAHNYRLLQKRAAPSEVIAVVKANAYGHGLIEVATTLFNQGCRAFAVTDAEEGKQLRTELLSDLQHKSDILLLSGLFDASDALLAKKHQLTPVLSEPTQLQYLIDIHFTGHVWLKVDTGMHRLGVADVHHFIKALKSANIHCCGMMSHLACADEPEHPLNQQQIKAFSTLQQTTNVPAYSLLNSAGIVAHHHHQQAKADFVRPGLALYGVEPIASQPLGLKPVMQLCGQIIQIRKVSAGASVSYGGTWVAEHDTTIAIINFGYGDGLPRLLSNQGKAHHASGDLPIIGRVCMDYCMLNTQHKDVCLGDNVTFFGYDNGVSLVRDVAAQCQTIAYELFTNINARVARRYIQDTSK